MSREGRTLGRYRLERLVGRGGMAEVWEARDQTLGRRVAVKIILPDLARDARFHDRFLSEARSVAALEHPNVLPIYDFGDADGEPYLVMPFLESGTLAERLKRGQVPAAQAIDWIRQLAAALDAAHDAGVLHRDVKPANVMIGAGGRLLLADFGIAKSSQSGQLTATGIALGTPAYMAPELARGEAATVESDRYALGVVAYELVCGKPPFAGDNPLALLHQHLTTPAPAVSSARPDLPHDLDPAFARILAKEPTERPRSCGELADQIATAFGAAAGPAASSRTEDVTLAAPAVTARPPAAPTAATRALLPAAAPSSARRRLPVLAAATVAVVVGVLGAWLWWTARTREPVELSSEDRAGAAAATPAIEAVGADVVAEPPIADTTAPPDVETAPAVPPPAPGEPLAAPPPPPAPASTDDDEPPSPPLAEEPQVAGIGAADSPDAPQRGPGGRAAAGRWALPSNEAFALFDRIGDAWRRGRFSADLFTDLERRLAEMDAAAGERPGVQFLRGWVAGGQALARGDRERARANVESYLAIANPPDWAALLPVRFLARREGTPADWEVALFWADPRNEARGLVEQALAASPADRNLQLARAVVEHLDGDHAAAARLAVALEPSLRHAGARVVLARFAGDQLLWSGDVPAAISWYKRLLVAPDRTEIGAVLRVLSQEGGPPLVARACAGGFMPACDAAKPAGPRARRARQP
jgi:serine/threonine-protein kinase